MATEQHHDLASVKELCTKYRNWGKWGPDDQLGTVNNITPEKIREAAGLVRKGTVFSLALPLDASGPMTGAYGRVNPVHVMLQDGGDIASGRLRRAVIETLACTCFGGRMIASLVRRMHDRPHGNRPHPRRRLPGAGHRQRGGDRRRLRS